MEDANFDVLKAMAANVAKELGGDARCTRVVSVYGVNSGVTLFQWERSEGGA
jgi:hypothetical protein